MEKLPKTKQLKDAICDGKSVIITHELFKRMTTEMLSLAHKNQYTLILDEVIKPIEKFEIPSGEMDLLIDGKRITIVDDRIEWNEKFKNEFYCCKIKEKLRHSALCGELKPIKLGIVSELTDTSLDPLIGIMKTISFGMLHLFHETYVLTYLYKGSLLKGYLESEGFKINHLTVAESKTGIILKDYKVDMEIKRKLRKLINLYDDHPQNKRRSGKPNYQDRRLTYNAYKKNTDKEFYRTLERNMNNVFINAFKAEKSKSMFTVYMDFYGEGLFNPKRWGLRAEYDKQNDNVRRSGFVSLSIRATNQYGHIKNVAYLIDRHPRPDERGFILRNGGSFSYDTYSVSEMLQWIWRSAIRNNERINLYIPSMRMRALFKVWLYTDYFEKFAHERKKGLTNRQLQILDSHMITDLWWENYDAIMEVLDVFM